MAIHHASFSFAVSIVGGLGVLGLPADVVDLGAPPVLQERFPDPLPLPCRKQNWTNADRICLSWTAPRDNMRETTAVATDRDRSDADTGTPVENSDYQVPSKFTGKLKKLTFNIDRPNLAPDDVKKLQQAQRNDKTSE